MKDKVTEAMEHDGSKRALDEHANNTADYDTFAAAYCMGAMAYGAEKEQARLEIQHAWKKYCGCTS